MGFNIGYMRVSTEQQTTERQLVDLPVMLDNVFEDKLTGANANRPQLQKCLVSLKEGDTLWVHSIDRLARNVEDLRDIVFKLMDKGVTVKFVKEGLDFSGDLAESMKYAMSKMLLTLLGAVAEFERSLINSRVKEGVARAKGKGIKFGRSNPDYGKNSGNGTKKLDAVINERKQQALEATAYVIPEIRKAVKYLGNRPTQAKVAEFLNDIKVFNPKGKHWTQSSLQRVMCRHNINLFS